MLRLPVLLLILGLSTAVVYAEPDKHTQALQLFDDSAKAYKAGNFEKAADLLRQAYALEPDPILLYNLGKALEGQGDTKAAIDQYERYLKDAKQIDDRKAIERRLETLKAQLAKQTEDEHKRQEDEKKRQEDEHKRQEDEKKRQEDEARRKRDQEEAERLRQQQQARAHEATVVHTWGPWITVSAGGLVLATGTIFGALSSSNHSSAVGEPSQAKANDLQQSAKRDAAVANVMLGLGGVAVLGGAVWELFEWRSRRDARRAAAGAQLQVSPTGVGVEWVFP